MSSLLEAINEGRYPSRSRNTLDDDEEDEARYRKFNSDGDRVGFDFRIDLSGEHMEVPHSVDLMIIAGNRTIGRFARECLVCIDELGRVEFSDKKWFMTLHVASSREFSCLLVVVEQNAGSGTIPQDECFQYGYIALNKICEVMKKVIVLDSLEYTKFVSQGQRCLPPLVRALYVSVSEEEKAKLEVPVLESGNILSNFTAALMTECAWASGIECDEKPSDCVSIGASIGLLTLCEAHIELESLHALVKPFLSVVKLWGGSRLLAEEKDIQAACHRIKDVRSIDQENMYV